ncbi:MAG TPA: neocarzinostatin apoprotein domain-containing protein [Acidimicrobiales bacterium]|nr:neocarzinostatin apoprotein domain-containing protein [Acidimicrobiales bacterium]
MGATAAPASAQTPPTVTVTPDQVVDGQTVTITTSGFGSGLHAFVECPASFADETTNTTIVDRCALLSSITDGPVPTSIDVTVREVFTPAFGGNAVHCESELGGCIVGTAVLTATGSDQRAWASISFLTVDMAAVPSRGLADGATTTVSGSELPDGTWTLAECAATYLSGRDPAQRDALCSPATAVTVVDGAFAVDLTVSDPLIAVDGSSIPCGYAGCVLDLSSTDSSVHGTSPISFGPPSITTEPAAPFGSADVVDVTLAGLPGDTAIVLQCGAPIAADRCGDGTSVALDPWGGGTAQDLRPRPLLTTPAGEVDCRAEACTIAAFVDGTVAASTPMTFRLPVVVTLTPDTGLLDGQSMAVDVSNLEPGRRYTLYRCGSGGCNELVSATASTDGAVTASVTATQRLGERTVCRDTCEIAIYDVGTRLGGANYAMSQGTVSADPSGDLTDGQTVQVSGHSVQPTYAGPNLGPFPTGGWAFVQCDASLVDAPSLYNAFDDCSVDAQAVTVDSAGFDGSREAAATIDTFFGRTVDCAASAGACIVGLYRFEADGSSTLVVTPLTFATP